MSAQIPNKIFDPAIKIATAIELILDGHSSNHEAEFLLCAITLYGSGELDKSATVQDAIDYFNNLKSRGDDCLDCILRYHCPLCRFYE